ncbi:hypothetical protein STXM2123_3225 [Streptomyces sp. F-3]|nr:hypothetical protein STXM2123_3225 [Streptomyces sp. F-3]
MAVGEDRDGTAFRRPLPSAHRPAATDTQCPASRSREAGHCA